jgi:hypothetical protein
MIPEELRIEFSRARFPITLYLLRVTVRALTHICKEIVAVFGLKRLIGEGNQAIFRVKQKEQK